MFQNATDLNDKKSDNNIKYRLKEIFRIQNIIIYILTFLASTISIRGRVEPFGMAMIAACVGETIPLIGVIIAAIAGTWVGNGIRSVGRLLVVLVVYLFFVLFIKSKVAIEERNEEIKSGGKLFAAYFIVSIIKGFIVKLPFYDIYMSAIAAGLVYVFYKIFVNGLAVIRDLLEKKIFTVEELVAGCIIVSVASMAYNGLTVLSLSVSNIIILLMIMILGWKKGIQVGLSTGAASGLIVCFISETSLFPMLFFTVSGLLAGALHKLGKAGVIIGVIIGSVIVSKYGNGDSTIIPYIKEIIVASIGLIFIPRTIKIEIEDVYGKDRMLDDKGDNRLSEAKKNNNNASDRLREITEMFINISNEQSKKPKINIEKQFLENIKSLHNNMFYDVIVDEETGIVKDICIKTVEKDSLNEEDLVDIFKEHNYYVFVDDESTEKDLQKIIRIANKALKVAKTENNKDKTEKTVIEENNAKSDSIDDKIEKTLKDRKINLLKCTSKELKNKKTIIELLLDYNDKKLRDKDTINSISNAISKAIGSKVVLQKERVNEEKNEYTQIYSSEDKYVLQVGSSRMTKEKSSTSGECSLQIKLSDGKYLLAIADGLGTGEKAREYSKLTLRMMKQLLSEGFDGEKSIKAIDSKINNMEDTKRYSTLDATVLDLYAGKINILKSGACPTFIKNDSIVKRIEIKTQSEKNVIQNQSLETNDGEILVMCSDGIINSKGKNGKWLNDFIKNINTNNVQKIADLILAEAIDNNKGIAEEDMTVIVSRIVKRK